MDTTWTEYENDILRPTFVGRKRELDYLANWLGSNNNVVFVTGKRGIGKTALIREFERKHDDFFTGGIFNLSATSGLHSVFETLNKYSFDELPALVAIDDIEVLSSEETALLLDWVNQEKSIKLVLSGRRVPDLRNIDMYLNLVLELSGLDALSVIKAHISGADRKTEEQVINTLSNNAALFQGLISTPRQAIQLAQKILKQDYVSPQQLEKEAEPNNIVIDETYDRENQYDYFGYILAVVLYIMSSISSQETEEKLVEEIQQIEQEVAELVIKKDSKGYKDAYIVTKFVNFRSQPTLNGNNIITVLAPNQQVVLLGIENGWAKAKYTDHVSEKTISGWVHSKYLKPYDERKEY